uniref:Uncharacterized protein n=1 Tax=Anguilla anguilla TaxID=7936 RepID=A0A0E9WEG8_ANGAN
MHHIPLSELCFGLKESVPFFTPWKPKQCIVHTGQCHALLFI